jgi:hypothetical protein
MESPMDITTVEFLPPLPVGAVYSVVHSGHIYTDCGALTAVICVTILLVEICLRNQSLYRVLNCISCSYKTTLKHLYFFHIIIKYISQRKILV